MDVDSGSDDDVVSDILSAAGTRETARGPTNENEVFMNVSISMFVSWTLSTRK